MNYLDINTTITNRDELVDTKQAARFLGLSPKTLRNWRCSGCKSRQKLPYVRIGARTIRYRRSDLEAFVASRVRTSTSDKGAF